MKEKLISNERYGVIETDKTGIITAYNGNGLNLISEFCNCKKENGLKGVSITALADSTAADPYDNTVPEKIISSINELKLIDRIFYKETETVITRFVKKDEASSVLFDLINHSSSLYLELDVNSDILSASDSFCKISGLDKSLVLGEPFSGFTDKKNIDKIKETLGHPENNGVRCLKIENIHFLFGGIVRVYDVEMFPLNDSIGKATGGLCHLIDTSLEKRCQKLSSSIRRMSAVANFAGGIAHDYNNALTAVLGNISLAKMDIEKSNEMYELLSDAESAGLKIKTLTERLGLFARGMKPSKKKTDIKELIENLLPEVFAVYKGHYQVIIQDDMQKPEIDEELISEALEHIIENAVDASDRSDGEIIVNAKEVNVENESVFRETSLVSGRYIVVSVKDNGYGIDQLISRDIFDPYVTTKAGREGLGLALAYTILKRHRGFISADTPENGGVVFNIYLPLF